MNHIYLCFYFSLPYTSPCFTLGGFYKLALTDFRICFEGRVSADEWA